MVLQLTAMDPDTDDALARGLLVAIVISVVLGVVLAALLAANLAGSLRALTRSMERVSAGDASAGLARPIRRWRGACAEAGWELNAHGYDQVPMHKLDDQKAVIDKSVAIISQVLRKAARVAGSDRAHADVRHARPTIRRRASNTSATGCSTTSR